MRNLAVAAVLALAILPGCSVFDRDRSDKPGVEQVEPRDITPQRLVEAYTAVAATAQLATVALKTQAINVEQAKQVQLLVKMALAAVEKSEERWIAGDRNGASAALTAALSAIETARQKANTVTKKGGS